VRVAIGNLRIDDLAPGKWRDLTAAELARLGR
jgi:16S rRNA U516 pseudouridylate synthase RsuA-like enzyme